LGSEICSDERDEHVEVQRDGSGSDELECDEHSRASTGGSDDGQCCGDGRWSCKQWSELYGDGSRAEHYQFESDVGIGGRFGDDRGSELWSDARDEHGEVQRDGSGSDELECDEHSCASTGGSNDGQCCGDGRWSGKQWSEL